MRHVPLQGERRSSPRVPEVNAMPYNTVSGGFERASRLGHMNAIVRAMADRSSFYVPAEHVRDLTWLTPKIRSRSTLPMPDSADELVSAIGVDGSLMVVPVRDGLPSVRYGYAQAAAIWLDLEAMEAQRRERFVDPVALSQAVNSRSEEHTSELQSRGHLVCRLLLEKKKQPLHQLLYRAIKKDVDE